jgi:hypothetical protein
MMRKYVSQSMLAALLFLSYGSVMAQDKPMAGEKQRRVIEVTQKLSDGTFKLLWSKLNVDFRKVVTGAPYSAIAVSEHTQTLSDGNQITRKSESTYYRDGEGRIRTERKLDNIGNWTATGNARQLIMIADPVTGRSYTLDPDSRTGRVDASPQVAKIAAKPMPPKVAANAIGPKVAARAELNCAGSNCEPMNKQPALAKESGREMMKKESLGRQVMEGIEVEGTRTTRTIPAGEIGNTLPIQIVDESWYSSELQLRVMIMHRDPRSGESIFRLTNVNRREPDKTLFEVPPDYRLVESVEKNGVRG